MTRAELGTLGDRVLLVDKASGGTSHDVVLELRKFLGCQRIGHAGTLDPFATGLLLLLIGKGTKLFPMLSCLDKAYEGEMLLGTETTSGDPNGEIVSTAATDGVMEADVRRVAGSLVGEREQVPPMTSAVKHHGKPLYKLNRRGIEVDREARRIRIDRFEVMSFANPRVAFRAQCSKGTYVRSLASDFGRELGVGAHLVALRRTDIGGFSVASAVSSDALCEGTPRELLARYGLSLSEALGNVSAVRLSPSGVRKVRCGVYPSPADLIDFDAVPKIGELVQLLDPAGDLVAVGRSSIPKGSAVPATRIELVRVI